MTAEIIQAYPFSIQLCVPETWTNEQILAFGETTRPCGTEYGWFIRPDGTPETSNTRERVQCELNSNNVHVILDA